MANIDYASKPIYHGTDNYGQAKSKYLDKVKAMTDEALQHECYSMIYQSARCSNRPGADWHWMVDACSDECEARGKPHIYTNAYNKCVKDNT